MSLYSDAATGVLTSAALDKYLETYNINEPSAEKGSSTLGLTPLAVAARNGHAEVVRLLLDKGAEVDAFSTQRRTPLWIVTSRGKGDNRVEIVDLLLKHGANVLYSDSSLQSGSTPLVNELAQRKDPEVIQLLVKNGGSTDAAVEATARLGRPEIDEAMKSPQQRGFARDSIVSLILAFILLILDLANNLIETGHQIFNKFQIRGERDSQMAEKIKAEIPKPKTGEELKKSVGDFVSKHKLGKFFKEDSQELLEKITVKAVELQNDKTTVLGEPDNADNLVKFALYQPVIYCDDSGSMNPKNNYEGEDRMADQRDLVRRIATICTKIVPDELGVHLRFINSEPPNADNLGMDAIQGILEGVKPSGYTELGTHLRERILQPLLYTQYNDTVKNMKRPLFVSIITDGVPYGGSGSPEKLHTLKDEIVKCQNYLLENGLPLRAVVFQISQIGSDPSSKNFLQKLKDENLENVYITAQQLDSKFRELRDNERDLEAWLFQTLLEPILDTRSD
ncbi:uncharacterized protein F4822DRAFT_445394 [Hypoxylon trugodes]|uniref:uncharacterized protein n=1 Tax=Hypoxylon trugodes TaxID=326681 RepID=UPI00219E7936|nr:uncharacterized protein F4822DRAFT_445394 [Hypoxylon trugodes]KAI1385442.1 hypothetical protein F4822DRAFT_445394 [Hypoxylon trugodes]